MLFSNRGKQIIQCFARLQVFILLLALSLSHAVLAADYQLGPGDVLKVIVQRHPEMSLDQVTISAAGRLDVPNVGSIKADGKTLDQIRAQIIQVLKRTLQRPEVDVALVQPRPKQVFIFGAVEKPGPYDIQPGWRISEAIAVAGGLTVRAELSEAVLDRQNAKSANINLGTVFANSSSPSNLVLRAGDTLRVSARTIQVHVVGQVLKPAVYEIPIESGAAEALAIAGGPVAKAALSKATVKRTDGSVVPVDLYKVTVMGAQQENIKLKSGDWLVIPPSQGRVSVAGAVQKPGYYDIEDGRPLYATEAVLMAGGPAQLAVLSKTVVRRDDGDIIPVDLFKVIERGEQAADLKLEPGDVVTVPKSEGVTITGGVQRPGTYNISESQSPRVLDLLNMAGGIAGKAGDSRITLVHNGNDGQTRVSEIDPVKLLEHNDDEQNLAIGDGDTVRVANARSKIIFVGGEVNTPGSYELREGQGINELLLRAGGPKPLAILTKVTITRKNGENVMVDATPTNPTDGQPAPTAITLQEGDFVVVPRNNNRVAVMNAVNQPGYYAVPEGGVLTVGEALMMAGGPRDRAKLKEIAIIKQTPEGVKHQIIDYSRIAQGEVSALNIPLQNGDILFVPQGKQSGSILQKALQALPVFGLLF